MLLVLAGCEEAPAPTPPSESEPAETSETSEAEGSEISEPLRLGVPPRLIARARQEAAGLYRMPRGLRRQALEERAAENAIPYATLRADPDAHAHEGAVFEGRVELVRSAGPRLWIFPLATRRDGERWVDPLYVLSSIPPQLPVDGPSVARVHGFVVGERTIGRNTLPLLVGYYIERLDDPAGDEDEGEVAP